MKKEHKPPVWIEFVLSRILDPRVLEVSLGDLEEKYKARLSKNMSPWMAKIIYVLESIGFIRLGKLINRSPIISIDMFYNYILTAIRSLKKQKLYSAINIAGLGIGLASCILILLYVRHEFSYDKFFDSGDRIYRLVTERKYPTHTSFFAVAPQSYADAIRSDYDEVETVTRITGPFNETSVTFTDSQGVIKEIEESNILAADSSFLSVFSVKLLKGNPKEALAHQGDLVLTQATAQKYFGHEDPIGKSVSTRFGEFKVSGICEDLPENSHLNFTSLVSRLTLPVAKIITYTTISAYTYVKLKPGISAETLENKFPKMVDKYASGEIERELGKSWADYKKEGNGYRYHLQPLQSIHLDPINYDFSLKPGGNLTYVKILIVAAIVILLIACINFINLATSRSAERAKEVGVRKVMGAFRWQLVNQFLMESIVLSVLSVFLAIGISMIILPYFNVLFERNLSFPFTLFSVSCLMVLALVVGLVAGIYPSFVLSSFTSIAVMKGNFAGSKKGNWLRNGLMIFQFGISMMLITSTLVVYRQINFMQDRELGFNKNELLVIEGLFGLPKDKTETFMNEIRQIHGINQVAGASAIPGKEQGFQGIQFQPEGTSEILTAKSMLVGDGLPETLGLSLKEGRWFSTDTNDSLSLILNESAVKAMGIDNPVGRKVSSVQRRPEGNITITYTIIGIASDFNFKSLRELVTPLGILSQENSINNYSYLLTKINTAGVNDRIDRIKEKWTSFFPHQAFKYSFVDENLAALYKTEQNTNRLFTFFSTLSILVSCIGLFALSAYTISLRTKEIGVRKVLGASTQTITLQLLKKFAVMVLIAFVLAAPTSFYMNNSWLQKFAFRIELTAWTTLLPGLAVFTVAVLTVAYHSIKGASQNPVKSLRME